MHTTTQRASDPLPDLSGGDPGISRALGQGLNTPLAALRATMESLRNELELVRAVPARRIDGVLGEVERLGRNVRELCAFAARPVPTPTPCTLAEVVLAARAQIPSEQRERVVIARCASAEPIRVDGPLLAECLRRLLDNALEATDEPVLVVARREGGQAIFSVLDDAPSAFDPAWRPVPFLSTKPNHLGLGLTLAQRDVALLGGRLEFLSTPEGSTCVRISIPSQEPSR
jgi:signal transduction histidine kinase